MNNKDYLRSDFIVSRQKTFWNSTFVLSQILHRTPTLPSFWGSFSGLHVFYVPFPYISVEIMLKFDTCAQLLKANYMDAIGKDCISIDIHHVEISGKAATASSHPEVDLLLYIEKEHWVES